MGIAPNTYWTARRRQPSARAARDAELKVEIRRVYDENLFVYGAAKIWAQLNAEGRHGRSLHHRVADAGDGPLRRAAGPDVDRHDRQRPRLRPAGRSRRAPLRGARPEPPVGCGHHLREDALGMGVRRVHHRRVLEVHRRLAGQPVAALGPRARRPGDGGVEPQTPRRRPLGTRPPLRPRRPIPQHPLLGSARPQRHRRVGRVEGATATTTASPSRSTASTSGSSSTGTDHGRASKTSSSPP